MRKMKVYTEAVKLNNIIYTDDSQVAAVRCVLLEPFLVYPSATDKQTIHLIQGAIVQALCSGLSPYKATVASPHPQTGHRWNAAPGILPQLTGCRAAAG